MEIIRPGVNVRANTEVNSVRQFSALNAFKSNRNLKPAEELQEKPETSSGVKTTSTPNLLDRIDVADVRKCASYVGEFNISDDDERDIACLGEFQNMCCALAHLAERTDRRFDRFRADGLDGVNDDDLRFQFFDLVQDPFERGLGRYVKVLCIAGQPFGPQFELAHRLFA